MTPEEITRLKEQRVSVIKQMRELNDAAKTEKRSFTAEETEKFSKMQKDERELKSKIDAEERDNTLKGYETEKPGTPEPEERNGPAEKELRVFNNYLLTGEKRDISVGANGGALAPQQFVKQVIAEVEKATPLITRVTQFHLTQASSLGVPNQDADATDADWTSEVPDSVTADATLKYGKRELNPNTLVKLIKVSDKLIKTSAFDIDSIVRGKVSAKMGNAFEKGILNGTGNGQPLGMFTASANGIPKSRDVTGSNTTTALKADSVIQTKMSLRQAYRARAVWIMHSDIFTDVLLLKDNNGQYMLRQGLTAGEPDRLLGNEIIESEFAPNTKAAGAYAALFGDPQYYWWAMVNQIEIKILNELYAEKNQIGYKGTAYADGQPTLAAAFARMAYAAS
jgi:HK97 family phage major capsid protein